MNEAFRMDISEAVREMRCAKGFICVKSGLDTLCRAMDIGLENNLICLDEGHPNCAYRLRLGFGEFCRCPIRLYIAKTLNR